MLALTASSALSCKLVNSKASKPCIAKPFTASVVPPLGKRQQISTTRVNFFKFGKNGYSSEDAGIYGSQKRDDYIYDDLEQYFNYMGILATEGTYDRMEAMLKNGLHPVDCILLFACSENDLPKLQEILRAGADVTVKDPSGKGAVELATKPEVIALLKEYAQKNNVTV